MKGQISTVLRRLSVSKRMAAAAILCGLVGIVPYLATQEQDEVEETPQPLTGVTTSTQNPLQIAILRWYDANLTTRFGVGTRPFGVAFAGANIFVTNKGSNTSISLLLSTSAVRICSRASWRRL
jgi:hypothetical protein